MGQTEINHIQSALSLTEESRKLGLPSGCTLIALAALGAGIHLQDIMAHNEGKCFPVDDLLGMHGLQIAQSYLLGSGVSEQALKQLLTETKVYLMADKPEFAPLRVAGIVMGIYDLSADEGHCVAIVNHSCLPRNLRRKCQATHSHIIIDTQAPKTCYAARTDHLAANINELLASGKEVAFYVITSLAS